MVMKITNSATSSISLVQTQLAMQMGEKFGEMKNQMDGMGKENANLKEEMANMKKALEGLKENMQKLGEENDN
jgi:predicted nuclease with TOPRIM domain